MSMSYASRSRSALRTQPPTKRAFPSPSAASTARVSGAVSQRLRAGSSFTGPSFPRNSPASLPSRPRYNAHDSGTRSSGACALSTRSGFSAGWPDRAGRRAAPRRSRRPRRCRAPARSLAHQPHHGKDGEAGAGLVGVEEASDRDEVGHDSGLFLGLAQGGMDERGVLRIRAPAGKAHLPGMAGEPGAALGEQHGRRLAQHDGKQHTAAGTNRTGSAGRLAGSRS